MVMQPTTRAPALALRALLAASVLLTAAASAWSPRPDQAQDHAPTIVRAGGSEQLRALHNAHAGGTQPGSTATGTRPPGARP